MSDVELRCHRCSHAVGNATLPMRIVGMFKASLAGRLASGDVGEVRKRCRSCGWVNVFHPVRQRAPAIEVKA